ncbi:MAG: hypothetical protein AAB493_01975 [Patescibacteria group bacterium]
MKINIKKLKNIFKKRPAPYGAEGSRSGFVLLFAVVVSSILLSVALGVSNIALKEMLFSTSAKDGNEAFYAADTAAECTLFYDSSSLVDNAFIGSNPPPLTYCDNRTFIFTKKSVPDIGFDSTFTFTIYRLGSSGKSCATVTISKMNDNSKTKVTSVGYNNSQTLISCIPTAASVQRVIEVVY